MTLLPLYAMVDGMCPMCLRWNNIWPLNCPSPIGPTIIRRRLTSGRLIFSEHFNESELNFAYIIKLITRGSEVCRHRDDRARTCPRYYATTIFLLNVRNHIPVRFVSAYVYFARMLATL